MTERTIYYVSVTDDTTRERPEPTGKYYTTREAAQAHCDELDAEQEARYSKMDRQDYEDRMREYVHKKREHAALVAAGLRCGEDRSPEPTLWRKHRPTSFYVEEATLEGEF